MEEPLVYKTAHGLGNRFVIFDLRHLPAETDFAHFLTSAEAQKIADPDRGIGADQVLLLVPPRGTATGETGLARMEVYNADGSRSEACGNGARCLAWLLLQERGGGLGTVALESGQDVLVSRLAKPMAEAGQYGDSASGWVEMVFAPPRILWNEIPVASEVDTLCLTPEALAGLLACEAGALPGAASLVSLGNPHIVFVVADPDAVDLPHLAGWLEAHPWFPERVNIQLITAPAERGAVPPRLHHRVWERGDGETPSSGTGAAAAAFALMRRGLVPPRVRVVEPSTGVLEVSLDGADEDTLAPCAPAPLRQVGPVCFMNEGVWDPLRTPRPGRKGQGEDEEPY